VVSLKKKTIKGHNYWYAVEMSRVNGKPKQTWQMYLGTVEKIVEAMKGSEGKPYAKIKSFEYGKIAAMLQINEELKFVDIVNKYTDKKSIEGLTVGEYLLLDIIGKSGGALSENSLEPWFNKSALSLLWKFPHKLTCQNFLNHMAYLDRNVIENIETDIIKTLIEKGIIPSILYLDESNWFTYSDNYDNSSDLLKKGHNKKHRNDKNQVNIALVANHENIPFIHETYPGNVHDSVEFPTLIDGIVNRLTDLKINTEDITLVFDKGNNSDKNIGKLTSKMSFVASAKSEQAEFLMDIPLTEFKNLYTNSKGHEKGFGKLIIFTDKSEWHSKKIVQTYNNKYLVEDDFKLLNDELLVPIGPIYHTKDFNIRVHVFLAVMGLLFYRYLAWKTKK